MDEIGIVGTRKEVEINDRNKRGGAPFRLGLGMYWRGKRISSKFLNMNLLISSQGYRWAFMRIYLEVEWARRSWKW